MLYSRDLKNHDTFIKMERIILELKLNWLKKGPSKMVVLKSLIEGLTTLKAIDLDISE